MPVLDLSPAGMAGSAKLHSLLPSPGNQVLLRAGVLSLGSLESAFSRLEKALTSAPTELGSKLHFLQR